MVRDKPNVAEAGKGNKKKKETKKKKITKWIKITNKIALNTPNKIKTSKIQLKRSDTQSDSALCIDKRGIRAFECSFILVRPQISHCGGPINSKILIVIKINYT
jgi:hypothetical protein